MISHERCKFCHQRKGMSEYTFKCPSRPEYGHSWESVAGNGVSWNESLIGKLWATKNGKIIIIAGIVIILFLFS